MSIASYFQHRSLYANLVFSKIILHMAMFITVVSLLLSSTTTTILALACIAPALANNIIITFLNLQLRTVLPVDVDRTRGMFLSDLDTSPNAYNFCQKSGEKRSDFVISVIKITFWIDVMATILMSLTVLSLIHTLVAHSALSLLILVSFIPMVYAVFYQYRDWLVNVQRHVNWVDFDL